MQARTLSQAAFPRLASEAALKFILMKVAGAAAAAGLLFLRPGIQFLRGKISLSSAARATLFSARIDFWDKGACGARLCERF